MRTTFYTSWMECFAAADGRAQWQQMNQLQTWMLTLLARAAVDPG